MVRANEPSRASEVCGRPHRGAQEDVWRIEAGWDHDFPGRQKHLIHEVLDVFDSHSEDDGAPACCCSEGRDRFLPSLGHCAQNLNRSIAEPAHHVLDGGCVPGQQRLPDLPRHVAGEQRVQPGRSHPLCILVARVILEHMCSLSARMQSTLPDVVTTGLESWFIASDIQAQMLTLLTIIKHAPGYGSPAWLACIDTPDEDSKASSHMIMQCVVTNGPP
jgi:hypothetical protein